MNELLGSFSKVQTGLTDAGTGQFFLIILLALLYGIGFRVVYFYYYRRNEPVDGSIARSFALMAPAVTTVFWLIQYSLPLSLGLLGALSFVRFRTPVKRAEDIAFILVLIAGSLACSVGKFGSALALLALIFLYSVLRDRFPKLSGDNERFAVVTFNTTSPVDAATVTQRLREKFSAISLVSSSTYDQSTSMVFNLPGANEKKQVEITSTLHAIDKSSRVDVFYPDSGLGTY